MMSQLQPWTEESLTRREDVFEALTAKALKQTMKQVTAGLDGIVTAAAAPEEPEPAVTMPEVPSNVAPPFSLSLLETAVTATWRTFVSNELFPFLVDTFLESAKKVAFGIAKVTGAKKPEVFTSDFASNALALANNRMVNIGDQVWGQIQTQLSEGFAAGESINQLASRLNTVAGLSTPRALVTARTEVIGAANAGAYEQMVFSGFTDEEVSKQWLATEDPRTRKSHREADGQTVALHQPFVVDVVQSVGGVDVTVGTENLNFPGDPLGSAGNVINCRCSIAFVFNDDDDEQDEDPVTAAGFDESKVKRDSEGKFAKKASRALGGIDKLTGKQTKAGKKVMLRTKVLFGTTYQDGAIIAVRPDSNERIIWNAADEKVLRQKKNADGKYETTETLTRGATYAKYGNEDGWESPAAGQNIATAPVPAPVDTVPTPEATPEPLAPVSDPSPTIPGAQKVSEEATQGVSGIAPKPLFSDTSSPSAKKFGNFTRENIFKGLADTSVPGGFVFAEVDGIKIQKGYPQTTGAPGALIFVKDEKTAKVYTFNQAKEFSDADFDNNIAAMKATPSKIKTPAVTSDAAVLQNLAKFAPPPKVKAEPATPGVDPLKKMDQTAKPVTTADLIPPVSSLKPTGKQLGTHWGQVYTDDDGNEWLFKQTSYGKTSYAVAEDVSYKLHDLAGLKTPASAVTTVNGSFGNIQKMFPNVKTLSPHNFNPKSLDVVQQFQLQKEHIFDWLISNHDAHAGNLLIDANNDLIGIDKGQAFRWLGVDKLALDFKPNPNEQAANKFYKAYADGKIDKIHPVTSGPLHDFIQKLQNIPDAEYRAIIRPYAEAAAKEGKLGAGGPSYLGIKQKGPFEKNDIEGFLDAAVARKNNLQADFNKFIKDVEAQRAANLGITVAPAVSLPSPSSVPAAVGTSTLVAQKPKYMSHGVLQNPKTTQYAHGTIIAERPSEGVRLRWNDHTKKYDLERKSKLSGLWFNDKSYSKQAAYKTFGGQDGWFEPLDATGAQADQAAGVPSVPTVAGNPSAPSIVSPTPATPKAKSTKFTVDTLKQQASGLDNFPASYYSSVGGKFKYGKGQPVTTKSQVAKIFQQAIAAQNYFNTSKAVTDGTAQPLSLLQTLQVIDKWSANPYDPVNGSNPNKELYLNAVLAWLQTPAGKTNSTKYLADKVALPGDASGATASTEKLTQAVFDVPLSTPTISNGPFPIVSLAEADVLYDEMTKDNPWSSETITAAKSYTGSTYSNINGSLRKKDSQGNPFTPKAASLRTAKKIQDGMRPLPRDIMVHRGIHNAQQFGISNDSLSALQALVGKSFQDRGFMSTGVAGGGFGGSIKLEIELPKGTPAMYIRNISQFKSSNENEMLLAAGTKFTVLEVRQDGWQKVVRMRVIP